MVSHAFNYNLKDAQAMPVTPLEPPDFDLARYEEFAAEADQRYAAFLQKQDGLAVWQRVRVGEVFRDACRDMRQSLRLQLGGLLKSLDYATDAKLRAALKGETANATVFVVAQRLSTVLDADRIVVLDNGRVVGIGTHADLLEKSEIYREIVASQVSLEEVA